MLYPKNIEQKLGFDRIREMLQERCSGPVGRLFVEKMRFTDKFHLIERLVSQVAEFVKLLASGSDFPRNNYIDIGPSLKKAAIPGAFLQLDEFYDLKRALLTLGGCLEFFEKDEKNEYPELKRLADKVVFDRQLLRDLEAVIDDRGQLRDNASPELARIRQQLHNSHHSIRKKMDQMVRDFKSKGFAKEGVSPTIRDGRMVIPVAAEYKRTIKGFVHDSSATGQTVYIEPEEVLNINNEIRELELRQRQEIIKILTRLTDKLRPAAENLGEANRFLGKMDFVQAKASFALEIEAIHPPAEDGPFMEWYHAIHPLLLVSHRRQNKPVVPQDVRLDAENRILLISGPNAGGKSVTLKTVGLIQYMFQCGLLVPVLETSKMGVFKNIFIDIGDQQSLDDDLSTYSSHLTNMKNFLLKANNRSLCLIDEFGSGTEPQLGAAIAEAILERLNQIEAWGVITTHYANLKFYADRTPGIVNGAMRFDVEKLTPLFQLETGKPGSSFALEIAQNIGLPGKVVSLARKKAGSEHINIEKLLAQLEQEKKDLEDQQFTLQKKEKELDTLRDKYHQLKEHYEQNRKQLLAEAKAEAQRLLQTANQKIENTIKAIKENQAEKHITRVMRRDLEEYKQQLLPAEEEDMPVATSSKTYRKVQQAPEEPEEVPTGPVTIGDYAKIKGQEAAGEVLEISGKEATLGIGQLKTKVKLKRLEKISKKTFKKQQAGSSGFESERRPSFDVHKKMLQFNSKLDLRGKRAEEALRLLDDFVDEALLLGQQSLTIVHGKGDGILRQVVRDRLKRIKDVKTMEDEHADRGGPGVTLVSLG